jgi:hypothetical protein
MRWVHLFAGFLAVALLALLTSCTTGPALRMSVADGAKDVRSIRPSK